MNHFDAMSLAEKLHTICFTAFVIAGTLCVFLGSDAHDRGH
jgi:hypothetical protein